MFSRKRPVVQLTSLLDLLFIMIFIALTAPMEAVPIDAPVEEPRESAAEIPPDQLTEKLEEARTKNELLAAISETPPESPATKAHIGEFRKLFVANLHYLRANYRYTETVIYSADNQSGLYEYRVHLQGGRNCRHQRRSTDGRRCGADQGLRRGDADARNHPPELPADTRPPTRHRLQTN